MSGFTRRDALSLAGAAGGGFLLFQGVDWLRPVGTDIAANPAAQEALADPVAPSSGSGPVRIAVYSDLACAPCKLGDARLLAAAREHGGVTIVYKHWSRLGLTSRRAAELALAADALGRHDAFYHALMASPLRLGETSMKEAWAEAGGDWAELLQTQAARRTEIARHLARVSQEAFTLGLAGTPGFLTRERLVVGVQSEAKLARLLG